MGRSPTVSEDRAPRREVHVCRVWTHQGDGLDMDRIEGENGAAQTCAWRRIALRPILALLGALAAGCDTTEPSGIDDCLAMDAGDSRDACLETTIVEVFREDSSRGEQIITEQVDNVQLRDFMWYIVTKEVNPGSNTYCSRIETESLAGRCREIVARPHLHRDLLKESGSTQGAGGGPPPGGGSPPPPQ